MPPTSHPKANAYVRWNLALLDAFFSPSSAGEEAWLQATAEAKPAILADAEVPWTNGAFTEEDPYVAFTRPTGRLAVIVGGPVATDGSSRR